MVSANALSLAPVRFWPGPVQRLLLVALLVCLTPVLHARSEDYEGKPISRIRFDPPDQPIPDEELNEFIQPLKSGEAFRSDAVRAAIERLYSTGRYDDIAVDAQPETGGIALTFVTTTQRFVRDVRVEGVPEPPNEGQLINATKLELGQDFSQAQLKQATESVMESLRLNGFYEAKVMPATMSVPIAQQIDVFIGVEPGQRAKYSTPVVTGNYQKSVRDIVRTARWRKYLGYGGFQQVTENRTARGVDRIRKSLQSADFLMGRVALDQMAYDPDTNTLTPHLSIDRGPKVQVKTVGAKFSRGKLRQLLPIYQEQSVDKDLLIEGKRSLQTNLQSQGYFEADVDYEIESTGPEEQTITYSIARGDRHKFAYLEISGNEYFTDKTLRERMYITPATFLRFRHGRFSSDFLRRDTNAIKDLYRANGFRDVAVSSEVEDDYRKENDIAVILQVKEGPQWFVNSLEITGASEANLLAIRGMLQSAERQPFSDYNVATDQDNILSYYYNSGYPDATFEASVTPAEEPYRMNLRYTIKEGERHYVRRVLTSGYRTTNPDLIRARIRNLDAGDPLSQSAITDNQRRLYDLGIFARVDTAIQNPEGETDHKYVLYRFEEASRYSFTWGFGAEIARIGGNPSTGLVSAQGSAGFSPRAVFGVSRGNFLGQGHTISFQSRVSRIQRRGLVSYLAPQFKGNENLNLTFSGLYDDSRDVNTFNSKRQEASVQLQQRFSKANSAQYRLAWRRVTVSNVIIDPALIDLLSQPVKLGIVSGTFIQDRRDDPADPHRGIYNTFDNGLASNLFGSKTSFTRSLLRNATYHRINRDLVFARSTSFGVMGKISRTDVPLPERFFSGGAVSHRGFGESQAGPRDPFTGFPSGGRALFLNNFELRFPLIGDNIGGVLFHDAGNVFRSIRDISFRANQNTARQFDPTGKFEYIPDFDYMVHAAGFGIRYRTPIGPVRVDLAFCMNPPQFIGFKGTREQLLAGTGTRADQQLSHIQFHFSLGQAF